MSVPLLSSVSMDYDNISFMLRILCNIVLLLLMRKISLLYKFILLQFYTSVLKNKIIEQVYSFNYLGNISYVKELDIDNKLHNYLKITGILNFIIDAKFNI
jgi:hypothetical protein